MFVVVRYLLAVFPLMYRSFFAGRALRYVFFFITCYPLIFAICAPRTEESGLP